MSRISGSDRVATAALLSSEHFASASGVVIVGADNWPDALAAGPWADTMHAPVLLARHGSLPSATAAELQRLRPTYVAVVGGTTSISNTTMAQIEDTLTTAVVERVAGNNRYDTARLIAQRVQQDSTKEVYIASGESFPDALALSGLAASSNAPLLLVRRDSVPPETAAALADLEYTWMTAAGGATVISQ